MHALFATPAYPPFPGGGERYVSSLAAALIQRGIEITVVTSTATREHHFWHPEPGSTEETTVDIDKMPHIYRCPTGSFPGGFNGLLAWRKAMVVLSGLPGDQSKLLRKMATRIPRIEGYEETLDNLPGHFDLVHSFNISWEYPILAASEYARKRSIPIVITPFVHTGKGYDDKISRNATMDHQLGLFHKANAVHTLTDLEKEHLHDHGLDPLKIETIGSGIDTSTEIDVDDLNWAREFSSVPFVLYIGRVSYDKGAFTAAEAVRRLRSRSENVRLVMVGQSTPDLDRFYQMIKPEERKGLIHLGVLSESKKQALLSCSSMLVLPSRTDSFGIVLLEAWSHKKPVIGARAGGIQEVITDGEDGLLVEFGDAEELAAKIKRLLVDPTLSARFAENGQRKIQERYTWQRVSKKVIASYQKLLAD